MQSASSYHTTTTGVTTAKKVSKQKRLKRKGTNSISNLSTVVEPFDHSA